MPKLQFKLATISDAKVIAELIHSAYREVGSRAGWTTEEHLVDGERVSTKEVEEIIQQAHSFFILAVVENQIQGCVHFKHESAQISYLGLLAVKPKLQARGLGKALILEVERMAHESGRAIIRMTVIDVRSELISFYQRRGYQLTGVVVPFPLPELMKKKEISLLEMQKDLKASYT